MSRNVLLSVLVAALFATSADAGPIHELIADFKVISHGGEGDEDDLFVVRSGKYLIESTGGHFHDYGGQLSIYDDGKGILVTRIDGAPFTPIAASTGYGFGEFELAYFSRTYLGSGPFDGTAVLPWETEFVFGPEWENVTSLFFGRPERYPDIGTLHVSSLTVEAAEPSAIFLLATAAVYVVCRRRASPSSSKRHALSQ